MTWDTEEMSDAHSQSHETTDSFGFSQSHQSQVTSDTYGYGSTIDQKVIWSQDPERAYFNLMVAGGSPVSNELKRRQQQQQQQHRSIGAGASTPRSAAIDSSGLSQYDTETEVDDAVAKIEADPEASGWFQANKKREASPPEPLQIPHAQGYSPDANPSPGMVYNFTSPISALSTRDLPGDGKANAGYAVPNPALVPGNRPGYGPDGKIIPGFIFVTPGHSSSVHTKKSSRDHQQKKAPPPPPPAARPPPKVMPQDISKSEISSKAGSAFTAEETRRHERRFCLCKIGLLLLLASLVVGIAMLAIIFKQKLDEGRENGKVLTAPTVAPILPPTTTGNVVPTVKSPTPSVLDEVKEFLVSQFPDSVHALENTTSPQYMALEWISEDIVPVRRTRGRRELEVSLSDPTLIQRWGLAVLFYATGGRPAEGAGSADPSTWTSSEGWLSISDECEWSFVQCNRDGKLENLVIRDNTLVGTIPLEIGVLGESLTTLAFNGNGLTGPLPSTIGLLSVLDRLNLEGNSLSGSLPSEMASMTSMSYCVLSRNSFSGELPAEISALKKLATLDLSMTLISGMIPSELGELDSLESLDLEGTGINGTIPIELGNLPMLTEFRVPRTSLTGSMPAGLCTNSSDAMILVADCDEIDCPCCTVCCSDGFDCFDVVPTAAPIATTSSPTASPTVAWMPPPVNATASPTVAPPLQDTGLPTFCSGDVSTDKLCYENGEDVKVSFQNCDARPDDWIGVYAAGRPDWANLDEPIAWLWTTGDQAVQFPVPSGTVIFADARGTGSFQVVLGRNRESPPFRAYAVSEPFELSSKCF